MQAHFTPLGRAPRRRCRMVEQTLRQALRRLACSPSSHHLRCAYVNPHDAQFLIIQCRTMRDSYDMLPHRGAVGAVQSLPELMQQQNGAAVSASAGGGAGCRSPGGAALEHLERQLEAEARSSQAFGSRLLHSVTGALQPSSVVLNSSDSGCCCLRTCYPSILVDVGCVHCFDDPSAAAGPGSATAGSPLASSTSAAPDGAAGHGAATDEGLEAAVAAEVDAAGGLTMRLRELCAL